MSRRLIRHIHAHPWRLAVTLVILLAMSLSLFTWSLIVSLNAAHQGRVENCRAVNELSRKIFITAADLGVPLAQRIKFLPTQQCHQLP